MSILVLFMHRSSAAADLGAVVQPVGEYLQDLEDVFKENKEEDEIISKNEWQEE